MHTQCTRSAQAVHTQCTRSAHECSAHECSAHECSAHECSAHECSAHAVHVHLLEAECQLGLARRRLVATARCSSTRGARSSRGLGRLRVAHTQRLAVAAVAAFDLASGGAHAGLDLRPHRGLPMGSERVSSDQRCCSRWQWPSTSHFQLRSWPATPERRASRARPWRVWRRRRPHPGRALRIWRGSGCRHYLRVSWSAQIWICAESGRPWSRANTCFHREGGGRAAVRAAVCPAERTDVAEGAVVDEELSELGFDIGVGWDLSEPDAGE